MDGNFGSDKGIVRNPTSALIRIIVLTAPYVGSSGWGVQLTRRKEIHVPMKHAVKWKINIAQSINVRGSIGYCWRFPYELGGAIGKGSGSLGRSWYALQRRILEWNDAAQCLMQAGDQEGFRRETHIQFFVLEAYRGLWEKRM